jgi:hypothetical protein
VVKTPLHRPVIHAPYNSSPTQVAMQIAIYARLATFMSVHSANQAAGESATMILPATTAPHVRAILTKRANSVNRRAVMEGTAASAAGIAQAAGVGTRVPCCTALDRTSPGGWRFDDPAVWQVDHAGVIGVDRRGVVSQRRGVVSERRGVVSQRRVSSASGGCRQPAAGTPRPGPRPSGYVFPSWATLVRTQPGQAIVVCFVEANARS